MWLVFAEEWKCWSEPWRCWWGFKVVVSSGADVFGLRGKRSITEQQNFGTHGLLLLQPRPQRAKCRSQPGPGTYLLLFLAFNGILRSYGISRGFLQEGLLMISYNQIYKFSWNVNFFGDVFCLAENKIYFNENKAFLTNFFYVLIQFLQHKCSQ